LKALRSKLRGTQQLKSSVIFPYKLAFGKANELAYSVASQGVSARQVFIYPFEALDFSAKIATLRGLHLTVANFCRVKRQRQTSSGGNCQFSLFLTKNSNFRKKEIAMMANRFKRSASQKQMPVCHYIGSPGN